MNFIEAVKATFEGDRVRRPNWHNDAYVFVKNRQLRESDERGTSPNSYEYQPDVDDILANDWVAVEVAEVEPTPRSSSSGTWGGGCSWP